MILFLQDKGVLINSSLFGDLNDLPFVALSEILLPLIAFLISSFFCSTPPSVRKEWWRLCSSGCKGWSSQSIRKHTAGTSLRCRETVLIIRCLWTLADCELCSEIIATLGCQLSCRIRNVMLSQMSILPIPREISKSEIIDFTSAKSLFLSCRMQNLSKLLSEKTIVSLSPWKHLMW